MFLNKKGNANEFVWSFLHIKRRKLKNEQIKKWLVWHEKYETVFCQPFCRWFGAKYSLIFPCLFFESSRTGSLGLPKVLLSCQSLLWFQTQWLSIDFFWNSKEDSIRQKKIGDGNFFWHKAELDWDTFLKEKIFWLLLWSCMELSDCA